ncbi:alpha-L-rhamnosidase C-terminal domain-containing protein [Streptomyces yanii]|uniref:Alpha-L-rhamnosidase C-terminal domain-containing protein n=1 Tax=Streptomyces yanii TaxID=78510 RepID=A0ABV5RK00_9ACTN
MASDIARRISVTHVEGSYEGPRGRISSAWRISGPDSADLALDVTIPANTAAEIHVPTVHPSRVRLDGRPVSASKSAVFKGGDAGRRHRPAEGARHRAQAEPIRS